MPDHDRDKARDKARLEAFSDGVFSIAITLLALDLKVPRDQDPANETALGAALLAQWPAYLAFVTSFFTILVMWVHHHNLFRLLRRTDSSFLFANGLLLALVTAVPFPTSLIAEYLTTPSARVAAAVYA